MANGYKKSSWQNYLTTIHCAATGTAIKCSQYFFVNTTALFFFLWLFFCLIILLNCRTSIFAHIFKMATLDFFSINILWYRGNSGGLNFLTLLQKQQSTNSCVYSMSGQRIKNYVFFFVLSLLLLSWIIGPLKSNNKISMVNFGLLLIAIENLKLEK